MIIERNNKEAFKRLLLLLTFKFKYKKNINLHVLPQIIIKYETTILCL